MTDIRYWVTFDGLSSRDFASIEDACKSAKDMSRKRSIPAYVEASNQVEPIAIYFADRAYKPEDESED